MGDFLTRLKQFIREPRNADTPVQAYTPPHLDPISPAIVSRDYWKNNRRRDEHRGDDHHRQHSSRDDRRSRRRRSSSDRHQHHREEHHRSGKRRKTSSRRDNEKSRRHRKEDDEYEQYDSGRLSKHEAYHDPSLVPDPLAVGGKPVKITSKQSLSRRPSAVGRSAR